MPSSWSLSFPTRFRVYHDIVRILEDSQLLHWQTSDFPDRFGELIHGVSPNIRYVDLTPVLESEARAGRMVYLPDDSHWSAEGHGVVAGHLATLQQSASSGHHTPGS